MYTTCLIVRRRNASIASPSRCWRAAGKLLLSATCQLSWARRAAVGTGILRKACPGELPDIAVTATTGGQRGGGRGQGIPAGARVRPSDALAVDNIQPGAIRAEADGIRVPARGE